MYKKIGLTIDYEQSLFHRLVSRARGEDRQDKKKATRNLDSRRKEPDFAPPLPLSSGTGAGGSGIIQNRKQLRVREGTSDYAWKVKLLEI